MNFTRFNSMFVLLCLFFAAQRIDAQCNITLSALVTHAGCMGDEHGAIDLTTDGGTAPYTYLWSTGQQEEDITDLAPGTYFVTVTDDLGCIANLARVVNGANTAMIVTLGGADINITCRDVNQNYNTELEATVVGGVPPYTYLWSDGSVANPLYTNTANTYTVTVTDAYGCKVSAQEVILLDTFPPNYDAGPDQVLSCANPLAELGVGPPTGAGFAYDWLIGPGNNGTAHDQYLFVGHAGFFQVFAYNLINGCKLVDWVTVVEDPGFPRSIIATPAKLSCSTTQITLDGSGSATGPQFRYAWTTTNGNIISGASSMSALVDEVGTYTLAVTNLTNNCTVTASVTVEYDLTTPVADAGTDTGLSCTSGTALLNGFGSSFAGPFSYLWTTLDGNIVSGLTTLNPTVDLAGTYTLIVTNLTTGCTASDAVKVYPGPAIFPQNFSILDVSCTGQLGGIGVTMTQGGAPYTYAWSNGGTNSNLINVTVGTYSITVTDVVGCKRYGEGVVGQGTPMFTLGASKTNPICTAGSPGAIDLSVSGVANLIEYAWSTGENTQDLNNVGAGTYTVTVTDFSTCTSTLSVALTDSAGITLSTAVTNANTCLGIQGHIDLTVTGGTAPYLYIWSDGETAEDASPLGAGTFTVILIDASGCSTSISATVGEDHALDLSTVVTNATCAANCNGVIDLTVSGGIAPYTYSWSDGSTTEDIMWLCPGNYYITVTDATGCTNSLSLLITASPSNIVLSTTHVNAACTGACTGSIDLTVSGGVTPYEYFWSTGPTTQDISNLCPATYTVTVADATGCREKIITVIAAQGSNMVLTAVPTNADCNGNNGSINLTVSGGSSPYVYSWTTGATTQNVLNVGAGTYTVTVTDFNGCTKTTSAVIGQTSNLTLTTLVTDVSCAGSDGGVDLTVTGGTPTYTYVWSNGHMVQDCFGLSAGTYTVTVMDAGGCTKTVSATVGQTSDLTLTTLVTDATCLGSDGGVDLTVTGGTPAYTYVWSNGHMVQDCFGLSAGTYTVTVMDAGGCTKTVSATVGQASTLTLSSTVTHVLCFGGNNGSINLTTTGGSTPYIFSWSDGAITEDRSNMVAGTYTVTVTDANLCTKTLSIPVSQPTNIVVSETHGNVLCNGGATGSIDLTVTGGATPYSYLWSSGHITQDRSNLVAGTYTVTVTDANFCTKSLSVTISEPTSITMTGNQVNVTCNGGSNGSIDLTVGGGMTPYTYLWNNNATQQDLSGLPAGTYTVTVTDANSCTKIHSITITQPLAMVVVHNTILVQCFGGSDGSIDLFVTGAVPPYTYLWSNSETTEDLVGLAAGTYTVTITDANNCTKAASILVDQPNPINFTITSLSVSCNTETITGPNLPGFSYQWSGPNGFSAATPEITVQNTGLYNLTISDANSCSVANYNVSLSGIDCGAIKGRVFHDEDESCSLNFGEPGLAGWIVRAEGANDTLYGVTNTQGRYLVGVPSGTYVMKVLVPNGLWSVCPGGAPVTVGMANDTVFGGDFPVQSLYNCPALTVSIGTSQLRRCFADNFYQVEYCNQGTQKATDAYINVVLDPYLTAITASLPFTDFGANVLHFELGDLDVGECGMFNIQVSVNCNASIGQTHCTEANIYPDTLCAPTSINWSGASLSVQSTCSADSLRFVIRNDGKAGMSNSAEYIVVEDGIMFRSGTLLPLAKNDSMLIAVPANGSTWRVEVGQESFHPYPSPVGLSVEGCTANASFTTGFINQFPYNDEPPTVDVDCTVNIGSFDPNDKYGYPVGYGADHYVRPGTDIEYLIRFQNTGTDTAFTVKVIDTLSIWLDPATIRFGASSHAYRYDLDGEGVVHFIFENILLPDSNKNVVASQGFAKFNIKPRSDAPLETLIENTAAIYFDFNEPVYTNTTFHRLGENFVTVGLWQPEMPDAQISAVPNPFNEETRLELKGLRDQDGLHLAVYDLQGRLVQEMDAETPVFHLKRKDWQAGVYLFKVTQNGRLVGNGKLVAD